MSPSQSSIGKCTDLFEKWYCLNGATCFTVEIKGEPSQYNCWCPPGFHGLRCDYKYLETRWNRHLVESSSTLATNSAVSSPSEAQAPVSKGGMEHSNMIPREAGDSKRQRYEAIISRPHNKQPPTTTRELHLLIYNLLLLLLAILLVLLILRFAKRQNRGTATTGGNRLRTTIMASTTITASLAATMADDGRGQRHIEGQNDDNDGQINHDNVAIELDMIEEERRRRWQLDWRLPLRRSEVKLDHSMSNNNQEWHPPHHWISLAGAGHHQPRLGEPV